jgi:hypothetical protein
MRLRPELVGANPDSARPAATPHQPFVNGIARPLLSALMCFTAVAVFTPFEPWFPLAGIDASWAFAINQAMAQGLSIGEDIIFTYGPYASIATLLYHPATDRLIFCGGLYLGICYAALLLMATRGIPSRWLVAFCLLLSALMVVRDPLFLSYPLLLAIVIYRLTLSDSVAMQLRLSPKWLTILLMTFPVLGLLPLIKGTLLPLATGVSLVCFFMLWRSQWKFAAVAVLAIPVVSSLLFWTLSGQPLAGLPHFILNLLPVIAGYTEAMATSGDPLESVAYLVAASPILMAVYGERNIASPAKLALLATFAMFLFLAFKNGFVRHDDNHVVIASTCVLFAALLLRCCAHGGYVNAALVLSALFWLGIYQVHAAGFGHSMSDRMLDPYLGVVKGIASRMNGDKLAQTYRRNLAAIRDEFAIPSLAGTTDLYSYEQAYLLASPNTWAPRPVLQSYSAYTPALARLDAQHLTGAASPDNIIFKVESIDHRFPSLDDGASWPALLHRYSPVRLERDFLFLSRRANSTPVPEPVWTVDESHDLGEIVRVPPAIAAGSFAEVELRQTALGRLTGFLYKTVQIEIEIETLDGTRRRYTLVPGMARAGFLLSPLVENTREFGALYGKPYLAKDKVVKTLRIFSGDGDSRMWQRAYRLKLSAIEASRDADVADVLGFDRFIDVGSGKTAVAIAAACEGSIDGLNGGTPATSGTINSATLSAHGWLALSAKQGLLPESALLTLTDDSGKTSYLAAHRVSRPDVGQAFSRVELANAGFATLADVSGFSGRYVLGLAMKVNGKVERCTQVNVPIVINQGTVPVAPPVTRPGTGDE